MAHTIATACNDLARALLAVERELATDRRTSPEDQLKVPISTFLTAVGNARSNQVNVFTEHRQLSGDNVEGVRLDMAVKNGRGQLTGHLELKSPNKSANPYRQSGWSKHDKKQWKRLENHSNLIYTNGWEWTLLRHGAGQPLAHIQLTPRPEGELPENQVEELSDLLDQFLSWKPTSPSSPKGLADQLAPLTRLLRDSVVEVITDNTPDALDNLYANWRKDLMPGATAKDFADSFAQTFTYALLLARVESTVPADSFTASVVTPDLRHNGHRLIGSVLEVMAQPSNRILVEGPVSLLESVIGAVDVDKFTSDADPWLYFYEDFLAAYDPKMRADAGVYYTPVQIVEMQVRLLDEILKTRFGRPDGLGDDATSVLDNATGTATYPLAVARHVLGQAASPQDAARSLAQRLYAFELLMGPYSVAHMRLTQMLESTGIELGKDGVNVYLTNSLTDPGDVSADGNQMTLWEVMADINEETRKAGLVKNDQTPIRVILGNPPYDRGSRKKALGSGSTEHRNIVLEEHNGHPALLEDFIKPLTEKGQGGQAKNLYNTYVYFIRWAIWKICEQRENETGVVSYITSSSYLRGPGFAGLREYMRRTFDEIWIVDLGGEGRGARKEENVFAIQTPVAVFFGIQHPKNSRGQNKHHKTRIKNPATVYYQRIGGTRQEKLDAMAGVCAPESGNDWVELPNKDWGDKFVPSTAAALSDGVPLDMIFPWSVSGAQYKRKWPIAPDPQALNKRWDKLFASGSVDEELFSPDRDCTPQVRKNDVFTDEPLPVLAGQDGRESMVKPARYGFRSFDRQWCLPDHRVGTYIRQPLWNSCSNSQLFLATLTSTALGSGPAVTVSPYVPDLHFVRGSFGAKDVHPLYRTAGTTQPNISSALLAALTSTYNREVEPFEVAAYVVGLLGTGAYTQRFGEELSEAVAHVPFTADTALFEQVVDFGRRIIFEQTWGERGGQLNQFGQPTGTRFKGTATIAIPTPEGTYPENWDYDEENHQLQVGTARFDHVSPQVASFEVSGMNVLSSWLGYRMKTPAGKSSSPLDQMQADSWHLDGELLELLWQIEFMVNAEKEGSQLLEQVVSSNLISVVDLGQPTPQEQKAPPKKQRGTLL